MTRDPYRSPNLPTNPLAAVERVTEANREDEEAEPMVPDALIYLHNLIETLTPNQEKFLTAKLYGMTDAKAARAVGLVPETVYNWKRDPKFKTVYDEVVNKPVEFAAKTTTYALAKAINQLVGLLDHNNIMVKQWAITQLIEIGGLKKQRVEVTRKDEPDLDGLLDRLEERANSDDRGHGSRT